MAGGPSGHLQNLEGVAYSIHVGGQWQWEYCGDDQLLQGFAALII
jgi:hypothetical protein